MDLPALEAIERQHEERGLAPPGWTERCRQLIERMLSEEPEGVRIAELDGEVVGWVAARPAVSLRFRAGLDGELLHLSVAAKVQKQGVGERLLLESEAYLRARGCEAVHISLPTQAQHLSDLLKRRGYDVTGWLLERKLK